MNDTQYQYLKQHPSVQALACTAKTRKEYVAWRAQWRADYKALSSNIRFDRLFERWNRSITEPKKTNLRKQLDAISQEEVKHGMSVIIALPKISLPDNPWENFSPATIMLAIRRLSKERAAEQRQIVRAVPGL